MFSSGINAGKITFINCLLTENIISIFASKYLKMSKTIMITGATSGFGRATAVLFAKNGYNIIITGRRKEKLEELEKELFTYGKIKVLSLNFDVRKQRGSCHNYQ